MMMKMVMTAAIMFFYAVAQCVCVCRFVPTAKQDEHGYVQVQIDNGVICTLSRKRSVAELVAVMQRHVFVISSRVIVHRRWH